MTFFEKIQLLGDVSEPFGFLYNYSEDIFTSSHDAWQRDFGYTSLYDETAPLFHMIFDCEPVYFDYDGKTWLIELWKGQYGINTGGEIGIYCAESLVPRHKRKETIFSAAEDCTLPRFTFRLYEQKDSLFTSCGRHWWLTGFCMGHFSNPCTLRMAACITFANDDMMQAFIDSLLDMGYLRCDLNIWQHSISFCFDKPKSRQPSLVKSCRRRWIQKKNHALCKLYCFVTRPFDHTLDKLIYLSFFFPFAFRRIVSMKNTARCRKHCGRRDRHEC